MHMGVFVQPFQTKFTHKGVGEESGGIPGEIREGEGRREKLRNNAYYLAIEKGLKGGSQEKLQ